MDEGNVHSNKVNELINNIINNEDNIINTVDYQKYSFTFNNKRTYNNWFEDLAPRVIILEVMNYHNVFTFECDFEISKYNEWANFMFGVYIRDDKGNTYLYGNNSMNSACFEHTGINSNVFENDINDNKYKIRVLYKDSVLQFIYTEYGDVIKEFKNEFVPYGDVNQIGITCKTWGNLSELELVADNIKIKVED